MTENELEILSFERRWWTHAAAKESAIRDRFGVSSGRYYQVLNSLIDRDEALEHDPLLVKRLRRVRRRRQTERAARRRGHHVTF